MRKTYFALAILAAGTLAVASPASATIHEIVASFCAATHEVGSPTGDLHDPPGLTPAVAGGTSQGDNVAQPLFASGAVTVRAANNGEQFWLLGPDAESLDDATLITADGSETFVEINVDHPAVKLRPLVHDGKSVYFLDPEAGAYVQLGEPDADFEAFASCENLP